jgi:hypothetical protein
MTRLGRDLKGLNSMKLGDNARVAFFEEFFHTMGDDNIWRTCSDSLESVTMTILLESHV